MIGNVAELVLNDDNEAMDEVAPDGSPIEVYLSLPAEPDLGRIRSALPAGTSVLDLGCGPGRIANPLAAAGHRVVAVDDSPEMLAHVVGPERVLGDVWSLDLGRRFGAVLALSHLINGHTRLQRVDMLRVCRRHLDDDGIVVVQRYSPGWTPNEGSGAVGPVGVRMHDVVVAEENFAAAVTYTVGERSWTQRFTAAVVDDDELASLAAETDLTVRGLIDGDDAWVLLGTVT
jgi:SAM-dependent methyltransferase